MPKLSDEPLHRLHIMVSEADHEWLKQKLDGEGTISDYFRKWIRRLRGISIREPTLSVVEILEREELTL